MPCPVSVSVSDLSAVRGTTRGPYWDSLSPADKEHLWEGALIHQVSGLSDIPHGVFQTVFNQFNSDVAYFNPSTNPNGLQHQSDALNTALSGYCAQQNPAPNPLPPPNPNPLPVPPPGYTGAIGPPGYGNTTGGGTTGGTTGGGTTGNVTTGTGDTGAGTTTTPNPLEEIKAWATSHMLLIGAGVAGWAVLTGKVNLRRLGL